MNVSRKPYATRGEKRKRILEMIVSGANDHTIFTMLKAEGFLAPTTARCDVRIIAEVREEYGEHDDVMNMLAQVERDEEFIKHSGSMP